MEALDLVGGLVTAGTTDHHVRRVVVLSAVMASAAIYTVVQGITYPLLSLVLASRQVPEWQIGLNAGLMPAGMLVAAALAPRIVARFGLTVTCVGSLLGVSISLLLIGVVDDHWFWLLPRFATGFLLSCIFVTTDTWVNELVDDTSRGKVIGTYSMLLSVGFAVGPALLSIVGSAGFLPFALVIALPVLAAVPLIAVRRRLPSSAGRPPASVFGFFRRVPVLLACVAAAAFADQGAMSLLPVYGLLHGYSESMASTLLTVMILGSIALTYPIGWLADRVSRSRLIIACVTATVFFTVLFPLASLSQLALLGVTFVWGGLYYAVYTLALVLLGERFHGEDLVAGTAACGAMWGIGGMLGTPLIGAAMKPVGPDGFAVSLAVAFGALLIFLLYAQRKSVTDDSRKGWGKYDDDSTGRADRAEPQGVERGGAEARRTEPGPHQA